MRREAPPRKTLYGSTALSLIHSKTSRNKRSILDAFEKDKFKISWEQVRTSAYPELGRPCYFGIEKYGTTTFLSTVRWSQRKLAAMLGIYDFHFFSE